MSVFKLTISTKNFEVKQKTLSKSLNRGWNRTLFIYRDLMVRRARLVHFYKNKTFLLTKSHKGKVNVKRKSISITNPVFYRKYVKRHYKSDWIQNSINYYRYKLKYDIEQVPNKYVKK